MAKSSSKNRNPKLPHLQPEVIIVGNGFPCLEDALERYFVREIEARREERRLSVVHAKAQGPKQ